MDIKLSHTVSILLNTLRVHHDLQTYECLLCGSYNDSGNMASLYKHAFRIIDRFWREYTGNPWFPFTKGQLCEAATFCQVEQAIEQIVKLPGIRDLLTFMWRRWNDFSD